MIKQIQKKFILISSLVLVGVFSILFSIFGVVSYATIDKKSSATIDFILTNDGKLPFLNEIPEDIKTPEFIYETRYFTVYLSDDNQAFTVNVDKIAAIDKTEAVELTWGLINDDKTSGFTGNYRYKSKAYDSGIMYVFLDCGRTISIFRSILITGILISLIAVLIIFICFILFSNKAIKPFKDNLEKQKQFITNASHELKTPLAIIKASSEVLEIENGKSEWTDSINDQIKKLTNLTENFVFLSRMDESEKLNLKSFSLTELAIELAENFQSIAKTQNKLYKISIEKDLQYNGDAALIGQLISILLDNAFKYSSDNGYVYIALFKSGKDTVLTVKNSVDGIETGNLNKYFDRFYREDSSRNSKKGGFGIGLSIAKAIVTAHKGKINANSQDGKSIEFTAIL